MFDELNVANFSKINYFDKNDKTIYEIKNAPAVSKNTQKHAGKNNKIDDDKFDNFNFYEKLPNIKDN